MKKRPSSKSQGDTTLPTTRRRKSSIPSSRRSIWAPNLCGCGKYMDNKCTELSNYMIGELPASLSLRTRIRIVLETRPLGHLWMIYQVFITLMACAYFAISAYVPNMKGLMIGELVFGASVVLDVLVRFYSSDHRRSYFFEQTTIIDLLSVIPLLSDLVRLILDAPNETGFRAPLFLRFVQVFKLLRILRVFRVGHQFSSPAIRQGIALILAVMCILYISASLINMSEDIPFGKALYFSIVTMATVGYGDISAASALGRFFSCCLICVSFIWVPYEINKLNQMLSLRSRYLTTFTPEADRPNVLLVGHLDAAKLSTFLAEFFHPDRRTLNSQASFYHVVILDSEEPDDEVVEVLEDPLIESRVTFVKGTLMDEDDLVRAGANCAVACFVFSDGLANDTEAADAITVLRVLVLKTFRPVLPCYVQLHHSHNRVQLHMLKKQRLVCIEDLKMSIMGLSALYPGFTTLLTNLLKSSVDLAVDERLPHWQKEYIRGGDLEIYIIKLPEAFSGLRFDKAARDVYSQFNGRVSLLGIEERQLHVKSGGPGGVDANHSQHSNYHIKRVLINPGKKYRINIQPPVFEVWGYVLARNRSTAEKVQYLELNHERIIPHSPTDLSSSRKSTASQRRFATGEEESSEEEGEEEEEESSDEFEEGDADQQEKDQQQRLRGSSASGKDWEVTPHLIHEIPSPPPPPARKQNNHSTSKVSFTIPPKHEISSGEGSGMGGGSDSVFACGLGESPNTEISCLTRLGSLDIGVTAVDDVRSMNLEDHIIVILPRTAEKLQCFLRPLRSHFLQGTHYSKPVVILTDVSLSQLEEYCNTLDVPAESARRTPDMAVPLAYDIYVVEGQTHKVADLRRAGIETAYTCMILADRSSVQEIDEEAVDDFVLHQFVTIEKLRSRMDPLLRRPLNYVVEVLSIATLKILDQTYKTFKGKAKKHKSRRAQSHFSDLRDRLSIFTSSSPIRHAMSHMGRSPVKGGGPRHTEGGGVGGSGGLGGHVPPMDTQVSDQAITINHTPGIGMNSVDFTVGHRTMYPFVTGGASFLIDIFDIISCQLFYNSDLIRFVDLLLALDHSSVSASGLGHNKASDLPAFTQDPNKAISGRLGRIPVPTEAVGHDYGYLYDMLMIDHETIPIALYRHDAKADVYYVYTGPPPLTTLYRSDHVFFLAPVHTIRDVLKKYPPKSFGGNNNAGPSDQPPRAI